MERNAMPDPHSGSSVQLMLLPCFTDSLKLGIRSWKSDSSTCLNFFFFPSNLKKVIRSSINVLPSQTSAKIIYLSSIEVFGMGSNTQPGSVSGGFRGTHPYRGQGSHRAEGKHYVFWNSCEKLCRLYGLQGPVRSLRGQRFLGITFVWAFAGGSPSSYAAVGWNHLVGGTGAALACWTASCIFLGKWAILLQGSDCVLRYSPSAGGQAPGM